MAKNITFWDIIEKTLETVKEPLSPKEIWEKTVELKINSNFETTGKTPWATIGAYIYTDINRGGNNSVFIQTSERPAQFYLRKLADKINVEKVKKEKEAKIINEEANTLKQFHERDLHSVLTAYVNAHTHFKAFLKTIFHEFSTKGTKGLNEWLHPDLVGVYFPFKDYKDEVLDIQTHLSISSIKIFSFEIKINLNFINLRQYYFQTVSNSSWANEGYLVVLNIEEDPILKDEIRRLNNAFRIGLIKLNPDNPFESEILFPAKYTPEIDWDTVNRLAVENPDFSSFLNELTEDIKLKKVKSKYDNILKPDELEKYILSKGIKKVRSN
jgi:hypothetical protein